jgi:hypothetical protein
LTEKQIEAIQIGAQIPKNKLGSGLPEPGVEEYLVDGLPEGLEITLKRYEDRAWRFTTSGTLVPRRKSAETTPRGPGEAFESSADALEAVRKYLWKWIGELPERGRRLSLADLSDGMHVIVHRVGSSGVFADTDGEAVLEKVAEGDFRFSRLTPFELAESAPFDVDRWDGDTIVNASDRHFEVYEIQASS